MFSYFPVSTETPVEASFVALDVLCQIVFYQPLGIPHLITGCMDTMALFRPGCHPCFHPPHASYFFIFLFLSISSSFAFPRVGHLTLLPGRNLGGWRF